jgi:glycerol-3-phosphate acyltransferase PlsY
MTTLLLTLFAAYLIGGIPFSFLIVRIFKGVDVRTAGSGNVGATNACRQFAPRYRPVTFAICTTLDALKGFLPALFLARLLGNGPAAGLAPSAQILMVGLAAILGHVYTPYLRFQGGKGVNTALGVFLAAAPVAMFISLGVGLAVMFATRYVSIGSCVIGLALPVVIRLWQPEENLLAGLSILVGAFIVYKHRANLARIARGEEPKMFEKDPEPGDGGEDQETEGLEDG